VASTKTLIEHYRRDPAAAGSLLSECFRKKELKPSDFELGEVFAECFGWDNYRACKAGKRLANDVFAEGRLAEAQGAVSTTAFQNISGQIVYSAVLDQYESEDFAFTKLIPETPTQFLEGEKIAGITQIGDETGVRKEGDPYPLMGVGEDWIFTPAIQDIGGIVPVTWEAVFSDRTGQLLEQCGKVGYWRGVRREKQAIDCCVDENVTRHRYNWRGTVIASYDDNTGSHTWDNLAASNAIVDWTDIDAAEQVFNGLTDPYTGEPIMIEPRHITVTKSLEQIARRIVSATEISLNAGGYAASGNVYRTTGNNPYLNKYDVVTSRLLASRMATDTTWFLADWSKYAKYMVAEKMNVVQAPTNNQDEFHRRIVQQYRVNERGAYVVVQPRAAVKCTA
jgi:hypothetical protein